MALCSHLATIMTPHRTPFLLLAAVLIPTTVWTSEEEQFQKPFFVSRRDMVAPL